MPLYLYVYVYLNYENKVFTIYNIFFAKAIIRAKVIRTNKILKVL